MSLRLVRQNLSNTLIKLFLLKKQVIGLTSSFPHKWIISVSKTCLLKTPNEEDELCLYVEKEKDSVPLKNLKLICVNLFEFYFLQTFQVQKLKSMKLWNTKIWKTFQDFHLPKESFLKPTYSMHGRTIRRKPFGAVK